MDRKQLRRDQAVGILMGMLGGLLTATLWPEVRSAAGWGGAMLWGAAIGAMFASLTQFESAGKIITRSESRFFNLVVGLCIPLLIIGLLWLALRFMG